MANRRQNVLSYLVLRILVVEAACLYDTLLVSQGPNTRYPGTEWLRTARIYKVAKGLR